MRIIRNMLIVASISFSATAFSTINAQEGLTHTLYINEVMQSAVGGDIDLLMEYPDSWVELFNPNKKSLSVKGYRIGKKDKFKKCYELPDWQIPARGTLMVYCDKSDTVVIVQQKDWRGNVISERKEIHADFRITTDTESGLYLFSPDSLLADSVHLPVMFKPNIAYGRLSDGAEEWGYELNVTKGAPNKGGHAIAILPDPTISPNGFLGGPDNTGLFVKTLRLNRLKMSNGETLPSTAVVRYTTDGTEPCDTSKILTSIGIYIDHSVIIKAAIFCEGYLTPDAITDVILFHPRKLTLPTVSLVVDSLDLYSSDYGIIELNNKETKYNWRRPAQFTYFSSSGLNAKVNQICEIRVSGGWSRDNSQKSLIAYADKRFGSEDWFEQAFWPTTRPDARRAQSVSLRNSGNDFGNSFIRDGVAQSLIGMNTDLDWQGYQPVILYKNGVYDGLINIRERGNEANVWTHNNGLEDVTLIENAVLKEGDWSQYQDFVNFYSADGHTYEEFDSVMDIIEYTNMMIGNIFFSNTDFPNNNNVLWRPIEDGGRWRWIIKDVDRAFGIWGHSSGEENLKWNLQLPNNISGETGNKDQWTILFRNLMKIDRYHELFLDRLTVYMGDFLTVSNMHKWINWAHDQVEPEYESYSKVQRVNSKSSWENEINKMKTWASERWTSMYKQLEDYYSLQKAVPVQVNRSTTEIGFQIITINDVPLTAGKFDGKLFPGKSYTFDGGSKYEGYDVIGWEVSITDAKGEVKKDTYMDEKITLTFPANIKQAVVNAVFGRSGIETSEEVVDVVSSRYYNAQGIESPVPYSGLNIVKHLMRDGSTVTVKKYFK